MRLFLKSVFKGISVILSFLLIVSFSTENYKQTYVIQKTFPGIKDTIPGDSLIFPFEDYENNPLSFKKNSPLFLKNPSNIQSFVKFDPKTGKFIFYDKIGNYNYRNPYYMSFKDYLKYSNNKDIHQYWMERSSLENIKGENSLVDRLVNKNLIVPIQGFDKIFGSNTINIKPQGTAELIFGLKINNNENPALTKDLQKNVNFDFDMNIKMGVAGQIGDKMRLGINFDTDATFEFENNAKLAYEGKEDEIIQKIEAGNVTMPLSGSLITGSRSLFGIKTELKFGKLYVTNVFSQQKGESKTIEVQGGATTTPFEITADNYDANRHYFISQYFRDRYDDALKNLPVIGSGINIRRIEVWVTNRSGKFENSRNIVAFTDLGENSEHLYSSNFTASSMKIPDNETNSLYQEMINQPGLRDIANVNTILSSYPDFEAGDDFEKVQNARLLSSSEYTFNASLGYISLNSALNNDEVLAVAFEYENTSDGKTYRVGEFSNEEPAAPEALFLKLLKPTTLSTENPTWDLMMKNVYSINAYQVNSQDFKLDIMYRNDKTGTSINYLPAGKIDGKILLQVMRLDNLNKNNEPGADGYFDFIDKITINASNGKVFFPVVEPFGSYLYEKITGGSNDPELNRIAEQYAFTELYDETQNQAIQKAEKNKFFLKGEYKSGGGSEINLNAMNVPEGSVTVTAGGATLVENQDYTVDYNLGRVTIINQSLLESGTPIKISLESNSMFAVGTKSMFGTHFDYRISENFNVGATIMHLHQKPLTTKVNIGDVPVSNTIWGTDVNFNKEVPFLTQFVDKFIPFIKTKAKSSIDFSGEFAQLIPGHPKIIGDKGYALIDDFEGAKVTIDLKSPSRWKISSTPQGQPDLFPEAQLSNDLKYGYNRAKIAWYSINRDFLSGTGALSYLTEEELADHRVREIPEKEIFPNRDPANDIQQFLYVLNLAYYPQEKGPYNFDIPGGEPNISSGINENGNLIDPQSRWGGISQSLLTNNFEEANIEFVEFWMLDPFIYNPQHSGGDIYFNLGSISEDILRDSRQAFENGMPVTSDVINVDTTVWGRVPVLPRITDAFATEPADARQYQDVGLDGLSDEDEQSFFAEYLQSIADNYGTGSKAYKNAVNDPSNDDYLFFKDPLYDEEQAGILERYKKFNNQEGNSFSKGDIVTATELRPDMEDINRDYTLSENEAYFQYKVHLAPDQMQIGENYITDIREVTVNVTDNPETIKWYHFKIPLDDYQKKIGQINDFKSIRFIRMFMKGWEQEIVLRFAQLDLVRGDWRKYKLSLLEGTEGSGTPEYTDAQLDINTVNVEENSSRQPVNYILPPGVTREISPGNPYLQKLNEQAISLKVYNLGDGDARAAYKNASLDVRQYKKLQMFIHAEAIEGEQINDDDLCAFVRLGSDYKENYYEYEIPLKLTEPGYYDKDSETDRELVWRPENMIDIDFEIFQALKQKRNALIREGKIINITSEYSEYTDETGKRISVTGTPNLSNIRTIMIGIRNRKKDSNILPDDGHPKSIEVWMNELRLAGFNENGGWASRARIQANLADFSTLALSGEYSTPGFGGIEETVDQRQKSTDFNYDFSASTELGKFFPKKYGIRIPLYFGYSEYKSNPEYDPLNPDIKMSATLSNLSQKEKTEFLKISQDYVKRKTINLTNIKISGNTEKKNKKTKKQENKKNLKKKPGTNKSGFKRKNTPIWAISNWTASYGYNELFSRNINTDHNLLKIHTGAIAYNYNITPHNVKPFGKVKLFRKKAFRILRDFNFYYAPSMIALRTDIRKSYNEILLRNIENADILIDETYDKQFNWNRTYDLKYNLSRSLKFSYSANNTAWVDEPDGKIDKTDEQKWKDYKNSVIDTLRTFGRTADFHQKLNATWNIPINKLPLLEWINANARYDADYFWTKGPVSPDSSINNLGNIIRNNQKIQLSSQANLDRIYRKVKFLKNVDNKFKGNKKSKKKKFKDVKFIKENVNLKKDKPRSIVHNLKTDNVKVKATDEKGKEIKGRTETINENKIKFYPEKSVKKAKIEITGKKEIKENFLRVLSDYTLYALMSVRNISFTYTSNNGSVIPGYMKKSNYLGFENLDFNNLNNNPPGWRFILGMQDDDFMSKAAINGWLSGDTLLNSPVLQNYDLTYNLKATLKPVKGLRIDLSADRRESSQKRSFWVNGENGIPEKQDNESLTGTFSMSFLSIKTAFEKITDSTYFSETYSRFLDYRLDAADMLADKREASGLNYDRNLLNNDSLPPDAFINTFPYGYNPTSKDVMLPAFIAAYSGQKVNSGMLKMLQQLPMPNWRVKYDGLTYYDVIKKHFKRITINHGYRSSYTVSSYRSNSAFVTDASYDGINFTNIRDELTETYFVTELLADAVMIDEKFVPLIGVDMKWKNDISTKIEYKQSRNLTLNFGNNTLTELIRKQYVLGLGYKIPDLEVPMVIQGNQKVFKSDLNFKFDFVFGDNYALIRRIKEADNQLSAGQKNMSIKISTDYNLDKVNLKIFYDRTVNSPRVSTTFKTSNTSIGFSLRFNLADI